jgi:hypothetical protein
MERAREARGGGGRFGAGLERGSEERRRRPARGEDMTEERREEAARPFRETLNRDMGGDEKEQRERGEKRGGRGGRGGGSGAVA